MAIKVTQISKDFNMKSKDIIDVFKELGLEKKSGASVETDEYELFIQFATASHQIKNINDYIDGITKIAVVSAPAEKKEEQPKTETAPETKVEVKTEVKVEPKTEVKAEAKAETKTETKATAPGNEIKTGAAQRQDNFKKADSFAQQQRGDKERQNYDRRDGKAPQGQ